MKPISKIRKSRSIFRIDPPSCALPPKKVPVPDPESVRSAIVFYFNRPLQPTLLFSHQAHRSIAYLTPPSTLLKTHSHRRPTAPQGGFLQVVVSKATAADSDEATNFLLCGRF
jgi:hypothetical protein